MNVGELKKELERFEDDQLVIFEDRESSTKRTGISFVVDVVSLAPGLCVLVSNHPYQDYHKEKDTDAQA